jgi:predicted amidophosphoribosyltransferase
VLTLKHGGRIALGPMMARLIAARLDMDGDGWLAVPVPLHRWRLWQRGFNQAAILARETARLKGMELCVDGLIRARPTPSLGGLGAAARSRALDGAIRISEKHREKIAGARILLVDDVLTSGATSNQCVAALKQAGAAQVVIACFARVLDEALDTT